MLDGVVWGFYIKRKEVRPERLPKTLRVTRTIRQS